MRIIWNVSECTKALGFFLALLLARGVAGKDVKGSKDSFLLVADQSSIRTYDLSGKPRDLVHKVSGVASLDYDCVADAVFWSDRNKIQSLVHGRQRTEVVKQSQWMPNKFAVDSVTRKVYVADSSSGTVSLYDLNTGKFAIIIGSNLTDIFGIALDLEQGYLFVQDKYKILRTDLDGENHKEIYTSYNKQQGASSSTSLVSPLNLTPIMADSQTKRLYSANTVNGELLSFNYDGKDRKVHFNGKIDRPYDRSSLGPVAISDGVLYWPYSSNNVLKVNLNSKSMNNKDGEVIIKNVQLQFIKAVSCWKQAQISNPCQKNNGDCQDLCVLSKSNKRKFKCTCQVGYELGDDNKSCRPIIGFLLFTMNKHLRGLSIDNPTKQPVDAIDPSAFNVDDVITFDFISSDNRELYYIKNYPQNKLYKLEMTEQGTETILNPDVMSSSVSSLAVDWVSRNLYYFSTHFPEVTLLNVLNLNNSTSSMVVMERLEAVPKDIVVHPNKGYLFFTQNMELNAKIFRVNLDGSSPTVIYQVLRKRIQCMALDYEKDMLYWVEHANVASQWRIVRPVLRKSTLAGQDVQEVYLSAQLVITSIAIHGDFIYAIVEDAMVIRLSKLQTLRNAVILADSFVSSSVSNLKVFSPVYQAVKDSNNPCRTKQCEKFCFNIPEFNGDGLKAVCGCPFGEVVAGDEKSCISKRNRKKNVSKYVVGAAAPAA